MNRLALHGINTSKMVHLIGSIRDGKGMEAIFDRNILESNNCKAFHFVILPKEMNFEG